MLGKRLDPLYSSLSRADFSFFPRVFGAKREKGSLAPFSLKKKNAPEKENRFDNIIFPEGFWSEARKRLSVNAFCKRVLPAEKEN
jgi:hypothetical protein